MSSSLKIGCISGLVSGFIAGIIGALSVLGILGIGFPWFFLPPPPVTFVSNITIVEISMALIWGIILGAIYSKAYDVIPGKGITKYLAYGLFCHLVLGIRMASFYMPSAQFWNSLALILAGFPKWIAYGLILGAIYHVTYYRCREPEAEVKVVVYGMGSGARVGAMLGILNGIVAWATIFSFTAAGIWAPFAELEIGYLMIDLAARIFIHMLWGAIFGAIFARVYNVIPGKNILKGLYYGLIVALLTGFQKGAIHLAYAYVAPLPELRALLIQFGEEWIVVDLFVYVIYGLLIGKLFRK